MGDEIDQIDKRLSVHEAVCAERYAQIKDTMADVKAEAKNNASKLDAVLAAVTKAQGAGWAFNKMAAVIAGLATLAVAVISAWLKYGVG